MNRATRALLVASVFFGVAILAFVLTTGGTTRVVHTQTTVVEAPALTPLPRDSGPKNNPQAETGASPGRSGRRTILPVGGSRAPGARSQFTPATAPKPTATHKPSGGAQGGSTAPQPPNPQPSPSKPAVGVTAPAPVTVCARPLVGVNC